MNSDPLIDQLSRFTPDSKALNRDAMLYAAGRASVRRQWWWPVLAGLFAVSQVMVLVALWPQNSPTPTNASSVTPSAPIEVPLVSEPEPSIPSREPSPWLISNELPPLKPGEVTEPDPPLWRVYSIPVELLQ